MNTPKAIEILEWKVKQNVFQVDPDALDALKLGIEALKEVERLRSYKALHVVKTLPGETDD